MISWSGLAGCGTDDRNPSSTPLIVNFFIASAKWGRPLGGESHVQSAPFVPPSRCRGVRNHGRGSSKSGARRAPLFLGLIRGNPMTCFFSSARSTYDVGTPLLLLLLLLPPPSDPLYILTVRVSERVNGTKSNRAEPHRAAPRRVASHRATDGTGRDGTVCRPLSRRTRQSAPDYRWNRKRGEDDRWPVLTVPRRAFTPYAVRRARSRRGEACFRS